MTLHTDDQGILRDGPLPECPECTPYYRQEVSYHEIGCQAARDCLIGAKIIVESDLTLCTDGVNCYDCTRTEAECACKGILPSRA